MPIKVDKIRGLRKRLAGQLLEMRKPGGYWEGALSSDTQSTAAAALAMYASGDIKRAGAAVAYLARCQNPDGGCGFSPGVESDIDSSIAAYAALFGCKTELDDGSVLERYQDYCQGKNFQTKQLVSALLLYLAGVTQELKLPPREVPGLPHPERMMLDVAHGITSGDTTLIERHQTTNGRVKTWRGLLSVTGIVATWLSKRDCCDSSTLRWLAEAQNADGGFPHTHSLGVWDTVIASLALLEAGEAPKATDWLYSVQEEGGGWFWDAQQLAYLDLDDVGYSVLVCLASGASVADERVRRGLAFIRRHQNPDGGFPTFEKVGTSDDRAYWNQSVPDVTAHVLRALKYAGERDEARAAERWLIRAGADGLWKGFWFRGDIYSTLGALEVIDKSELELTKVTQQLVPLQNGDGGFGAGQSTIEETAWACAALCELGADKKLLDEAMGWLCRRCEETLAPAHVGALPLFKKLYSDSVFPAAFALSALNKYISHEGKV